jgi:hypothetical protein
MVELQGKFESTEEGHEVSEIGTLRQSPVVGPALDGGEEEDHRWGRHMDPPLFAHAHASAAMRTHFCMAPHAAWRLRWCRTRMWCSW